MFFAMMALHAEVVEGRYFTFEYGDSRYFEHTRYDDFEDFELLQWGCYTEDRKCMMVVAFFVPKGVAVPPLIYTEEGYRELELKDGKVRMLYSFTLDETGRSYEEFLYRLRFK